jgi:Domain of unknown function (DUF4926)
MRIKPLSLFDVVAVKRPLPAKKLVTGQVGTIVEILSKEAFEVEFIDDNGTPYAQVPLRADQLIPLRFSPKQSRAVHMPKIGQAIPARRARV